MKKGLGGDAPEVRILTSPPGTEEPENLPSKQALTVPRTFINNEPTADPVEKVIAKVHDYSQDTVNTHGVGRRRTVEQAIGSSESVDSEWVDFEQSNRVSARWVFRREVTRRYKPALMVMNTDIEKFDAKVGVGSNAYSSLGDYAKEAVEEYLRYAVIKQHKPKPYKVGAR